MTVSCVESRYDSVDTLTISEKFMAKSLLQFSILHPDHYRAGDDGEHGQHPTDRKSRAYAPGQHFTQVTEIYGVADSGADSGCDESLSIASRVDFRQASQLRPAEMGSGT